MEVRGSGNQLHGSGNLMVMPPVKRHSNRAGNDVFYMLRMVISTLRFFIRPSSVSFDAIGYFGP